MMARFHMYKKVITWEQLWKCCNHRKLCRFCDIITDECEDKDCKPNNDTKARCPIWNGMLENLVMVRKDNYRRDNNGQERPHQKFHDEKRDSQD